MLSARLAGASKASKSRMSKGKVKFCDFQKKSPKKTTLRIVHQKLY